MSEHPRNDAVFPPIHSSINCSGRISLDMKQRRTCERGIAPTHAWPAASTPSIPSLRYQITETPKNALDAHLTRRDAQILLPRPLSRGTNAARTCVRSHLNRTLAPAWKPRKKATLFGNSLLVATRAEHSVTTLHDSCGTLTKTL